MLLPKSSDCLFAILYPQYRAVDSPQQTKDQIIFRYDTKRLLLLGLKRAQRMQAPKNDARYTGAALKQLADSQFNLGEPSSTVRPFHTPIVVVLTTGKSKDTTEQDAIKKLTNRYKKEVVFLLYKDDEFYRFRLTKKVVYVGRTVILV